MNDPFLTKVYDTIEQFDMFSKSERLLVCLSGGADSVSLLLCLKKLGYDISACHVNHQLRGDESERDQKFCEELCNKLGVELTVQRIDVKGYCKEKSVSTEQKKVQGNCVIRSSIRSMLTRSAQLIRFLTA